MGRASRHRDEDDDDDTYVDSEDSDTDDEVEQISSSAANKVCHLHSVLHYGNVWRHCGNHRAQVCWL